MSTSDGLSVWSERVERPGVVGLHDCAYASALMALEWGGWARFPLGRTAAEREALEASDDRPDETGARKEDVDLAVRRRYGIRMRPIADGSRAGLLATLAVPNLALTLPGRLSHFPAGHRLRRWDPGFEGGHEVCVVTLGGGAAWWGDPLAPMGYAGDRVTIAEAAAFAWYPNDARMVRAGEFAEDEPMIKTGTIHTAATPCEVALPKGALTFPAPDATAGGTPLTYDYLATAVGVTPDKVFGAYVLNAGGLRYFRLEDVRGVHRLLTVNEAVAALRKGAAS